VAYFVLHLDSCPVGIFGTLDEAKAEGEKHASDRGDVHIEMPVAPAATQGWRLDRDISDWVKTPAPPALPS